MLHELKSLSELNIRSQSKNVWDRFDTVYGFVRVLLQYVKKKAV